MNKIKRLTSKIKFEKRSIPPAFFIASVISTLIILSFDYHVSSFNRIVSLATANDFDISKLIFSIITTTIVFIVSFCISYIFFNRVRAKYSNQTSLASFWHFFNRFSIVASIVAFIILISAFYTKELSSTEPVIFTPTLSILLICFGSLILYILLNLKDRIKFNTYQKIIIISLLFGFSVCIAIPRFLPYINLVQTGLSILCITLIKFIKIKPNLLDSFTSGFVIVFSVLPALLSIYIETLNIFNQHEIFITNPLLIYRVILGILIAIAIGISFFIYKKSLLIKNWQRFVYPTLVIGIAMLSVQLPLTGEYTVDLFESANYSVLISDFFNFGKIPIIEHYGGHMLTKFFGGISYGLLNNDFGNAIYSPYGIYFYIIIYIIAYFFIKKIVDRDTAFLAIIFLPLTKYNFSYFGLGFIAIFSLLYYFKKPNFKNAFLVDLCLLICILYRLDLGVAFSIASIAAAIIYTIVKKKTLKKIILSSIIFIIFLLSIWFIICGAKGLDGFTQIKQFVMISASNQNWAYPMFEKTSELIFAWSYIILPVIMASSLLYIIFSKARNKIDSKVWLILLVLGISYFANFTRSIVRHNVSCLPDTSHTIFWTSYVYLAILVATFKKNYLYFLPTYMTFTMFNIAIIGSSFARIDFQTPLDASQKHLNIASYAADYKVNRVSINPSAETELSELATFIKPFLNSDDTFFDFTNRSFIYSYLNRTDPIYAAQTPGHLNGDITSKIAISDLEKSNVKLTIMTNGKRFHVIDNIPNSLRYYRISEYIYQNFIPLLEFETGEIWIARNLYQDSLKIAKKLCEETSCQVLSKNNKPSETYDIGYIPLSWGEKDIENASSNEKITDAKLNSNGYYIFDNNFDKSTGNYVKLIINSDNTHNEEVTLGSLTNSGFKEAAKYIFTVEPGEHTYLLRASHDEDWYNGNVNAIKTPINADITILKGD